MQGRWATLLIAVIAAIAVETPRLIAFVPNGWRWSLACETMVYALMLAVPLLLARLAPKASAFDRQWLPSARLHWVWFFGMVLLVLVGGGLATWLSGIPSHHYRTSYTFGRPARVVAVGLLTVLIGPIAEEFFWRVFFLEQLRKITYSTVAILSQACVFALSHLWLVRQGGTLLIAVLWYGTVFGTWRVRFRSILPLIFAHMLLNVLAIGPSLKREYDYAARSWLKPNIQQIELLAEEPPEKAVPAIIAFLADCDEEVRNRAVAMLTTRYRSCAGPYLKHALASNDTQIVNGVLFVIEIAPSFGLGAEVREIAWSTDDRSLQIGAVLALERLQDIEALEEISREHYDETVRQAANHGLRHARGGLGVGGVGVRP